VIAVSFNASNFDSLFQMEQRHFWHAGRREILLDTLKRNISSLPTSIMLEIGCGNGSVLAYLHKNGITVEGCDLFLEGLQYCRRRSASIPLYQVDATALPFYDSYDIVGSFDVLEHIADDEKALREIYTALKPGGYILLTVPAYPFLWSHFDEVSHHQRRYKKKELMDKLERNGFTVLKASFFMCFLFPLIAASRILGKVFNRKKTEKSEIGTSMETRTIPVFNELFLDILRLERYFLRYMVLPFGSSLLIIASKN